MGHDRDRGLTCGKQGKREEQHDGDRGLTCGKQGKREGEHDVQTVNVCLISMFSDLKSVSFHQTIKGM